jgi:hypothetical protein
VKRIGLYYLGHEQVELYTNSDNGGHFSVCPKGKLPQIIVGLGYSEWWRVLSVLMHEALEFSMVRHHVRYEPTLEMSKDANTYFFAFDHTQFSSINACAADFVASSLNDLHKVWKAHQKTVK